MMFKKPGQYDPNERLKKQPGSPMRIMQVLGGGSMVPRGTGVIGGGVAPQPGIPQKRPQEERPVTPAPVQQQVPQQPQQQPGQWSTGREESRQGGGHYSNGSGMWTSSRRNPEPGAPPPPATPTPSDTSYQGPTDIGRLPMDIPQTQINTGYQGRIGTQRYQNPVIKQTGSNSRFGSPSPTNYYQSRIDASSAPKSNIGHSSSSLVAEGTPSDVSDTRKKDSSGSEVQTNYWNTDEGRQKIMEYYRRQGVNVVIDAEGNIYDYGNNSAGRGNQTQYGQHRNLGNVNDPGSWDSSVNDATSDASGASGIKGPRGEHLGGSEEPKPEEKVPLAELPKLDEKALAEMERATRADYAKQKARAIRAAAERAAYGGVGADSAQAAYGDLSSDYDTATNRDVAVQKLEAQKQNFSAQLQQLQMQHQLALQQGQFAHANAMAQQAAQIQANLIRLQNELSSQVGWDDVLGLGGNLFMGGFGYAMGRPR